MNNINKIIAVFAITIFTTGCMQQFEPLDDFATDKQTKEANGAYENFVQTITSTLAGQFIYGGNSSDARDFGYPSLMLQRDILGQDIFQNKLNWYDGWYTSQYLGPTYRLSQIPWTYYYKWIKNCNTVLTLAGEQPAADQIHGVGIAYAMRAFFYLDLAQMYSKDTYLKNKSSETVPIVTHLSSFKEAANPRATNEEMYAFILSDLDKAEEYLKDYNRNDKFTPDISVVYGLKARAYLIMGEWANAKKYAKMAQSGYSLMTDDEYTSKDLGFNTPNASWMFGCQYKEDDPCMLENDGDTSWGSQMILEIDPEKSGCGYGANYGQFWLIDRHLYETMPESDFRKKCFVDFNIDKLANKEAKIEALKPYSDYPQWVYNTGYQTGGDIAAVGGLPLKFRAKGGENGRMNQMTAWSVAVPLMRVEEMYLIEAEAAGMLNESEGISLLTTFAKTRDANFVYGKHNESYGNTANTAFQNECWWQRRVEFWGEGLATFDIKRLGKGIIRSYANTNHIDGYRWNTNGVPAWMTFTIVQTETNYNSACTNNETPIAPEGNSPEYNF